MQKCKKLYRYSKNTKGILKFLQHNTLPVSIKLPSMHAWRYILNNRHTDIMWYNAITDIANFSENYDGIICTKII